MEICIFYSWQSRYHDNCDKIISKALDKAVKELNKCNDVIQYYIERGGGDVLGAEPIDENIYKIIKNRADIAFVDFTHTGSIPEMDATTGVWNKIQCNPNTNVVHENGMLEASLNRRLVFKVYNTAYGDLKNNLEMPFDLRQGHFPLPFYCSDETTEEGRIAVIDCLKKGLISLIKKGTQEFLDNQKIRFAPLVPLRIEYTKELYKTTFLPVKCFSEIRDKIGKGNSFRLLGLPGLGKTRMVGEAFRGNDIDVYYCDCRNVLKHKVQDAVEVLLTERAESKQIVILDNCDQKLCGYISDSINENGFNCQLITIHYDPSEKVDNGIDPLFLKVEDSNDAVKAMVKDVTGMPSDVQDSIVELSGGFPLMASIMIDNFKKDIPIVNVSKKDVFERMLGIDPQRADDVDKLKVLTSFSIFKFIGLYGAQEKQGRFIAGNRIVTNIRGTEDDNLQLFREVHAQYQNVEILERQGNLVLMRLIPLAIYLCKSWFDRQTTESIAELISQIRSCPDEGTRNMTIESLSRRITLLADVPLAKDLNDGLTNPETSPFLTEEVVLSTLGSRLFLAFSEVNPEACAIALHKIISKKSNEEILAIESTRRNLAWALDHLAFDVRSFRFAMLTLARFSLVETESHISNNTTGLFIDRFSILLSGTEVNLQNRIDLLQELKKDTNYNELIKKALLKGLKSGHFHRSGGAERQGTRKLVDNTPTRVEVINYYSACLEMLLEYNDQVILDETSKVLAENARGYYLSGVEEFLFKALNLIAEKKEFIWEEMKESLALMLDYDVKKRGDLYVPEINEWKDRLSKDDYVYKLFHIENDVFRHYNLSHEESIKLINEQYCLMARELVDKELYKDENIVAGLVKGKGLFCNIYGVELSAYSKSKGLQSELLAIILNHVLTNEVSPDGDSLLIYFLIQVDDYKLLETVYETLLGSEKKYLLVAAYSIKSEAENRLAQLFDLLNSGELSIGDFTLYFKYRFLNHFDVKYVAKRLLDYGSQGASLVLTYCHSMFFREDVIDEEYQEIGRNCLLSIDLQSFKMNDYLYLETVNNYLVKRHDDELALHIQDLLETFFKKEVTFDNYYIGRLYGKVIKKYSYILKERLLSLLDDKVLRHQCIDLLRTSYPQENETEPMYHFMSENEWFEWLNDDSEKDRAYVLAMMFSYAESGGASPAYLRLVNEHWGDDVKDALGTRLHSFSWTGSGIPLYFDRIHLCEDYINKVTDDEVKIWFEQDIVYWKNEIEQERLQNAHERAIYN